jgi:thioredoxin reductase (NADPH)
MSEVRDCVIVGGGPAGLTAAIYLGRFHRPALVIDAGDPRAGWIPTSHNHPGFPEGVNGGELIGLMQGQAQIYEAEVRQGEVRRLERDGAAACSGSTLRWASCGRGLSFWRPACATCSRIAGARVMSSTQWAVVRWCTICGRLTRSGAGSGWR